MNASDCPLPPPKPDPDLLGFKPHQPMVRWFSPVELVRAGIKSLLSSLFGAYADYREIQAVRSEIAPISYADRDELWIDYVADLGDGFDSTYAVARLLAEPALTLDDGGTPVETRRGNLLVMGGDQVYPTATREAYAQRLVGPYRAALPCVQPPEAAPHLYAVPGNHDWYDGLTSFTRLFCLNRWIGGWKTQQTRSYFALALPHGWWLWGIDFQLDADIDLPQLDFFRSVAAAIPPGSKVILCVAEPAWVYADLDGPEAYEGLAFFERETIQRYGHQHVVGLGSDLHAYARYASADGRQRFVSGGGGAYLYPTHRLPSTLHIPTQPGPEAHDEAGAEVFVMGGTAGDPASELLGETEPAGPPRPEAVFPERATSRRLAWRSLLFPFYNPGFAVFTGAFYLFLCWLVQSASKMQPPSFLQTLAEVGPAPTPAALTATLWHFWHVLAHAPFSVLTVLVLAATLISFADAKGVGKVALGLAHTTIHIVTLVLLTWAFATINLGVLGLSEDAPLQVLLFTVEMVVVGGVVGSFVVGLYFFLTHVLLPGVHTNEVFCCQSRPDYKHVLRLHLDREGGLTIYPIGLKRVPKTWRYRPDAGPGEAWYEPARGTLAERAALIEPPVRLAPAPVRGSWLRRRGEPAPRPEVSEVRLEREKVPHERAEAAPEANVQVVHGGLAEDV